MNSQSQFARALLDPELDPPHAVLADAHRFDIYRNNVMASLCDVLALVYPVVEKMVGSEYFAALARAFVRHQPPRSPIMSEYGDGMAEFIAGLAPLADYPYLPDIARLEWARLTVMREALALPRNSGLAPACPEKLMDMTVRIQPGARLIRSAFPIVSLWTSHQEEVPGGPSCWAGEQVLVFRNPEGIAHAALSSADFDFLDNLPRHGTLGEALFAVSDPLQAAHALGLTLTLLAGGALQVSDGPTAPPANVKGN